jgi:5-methylcytosine-specific restriction protein A
VHFDWTYDEVVLAADLVARNNFNGLRAHHEPVIELSELLRAAPIHPVEEREANFRSPSSVQRKTFDIATQHKDYQGAPTKGGRYDAKVLSEFVEDPARMRAVAESIRSTILEGEVAFVPNEEIDAEEMSADEGRLLVARHLRRERSPKLRRAKIAKVKTDGLPVACEVCQFDFAASYGELGQDYIEVHHVLPLHAAGSRRTRLQDLALLCANCHRMIHRSTPWLTPDQLRALLQSH